VHYADYKNHNKNGDATDFLAKNTKSAISKLRKKSPFSKVSSGWSIKKL
jgi:hypothetical protein